MKILTIPLALLALVSLAAGGKLRRDADNDAKQFRDENNKFTSKFMNEVASSKPGENLVMSAFSLMQPLAQIGLASEGESHDELLKAVGLSNDDQVKELFPSLNSNLRAVKGVTLNMANKIYIPNKYELNTEFGQLSKTVFGSEVQNIEFTKNVEAANEINKWVEDHTNNRIKDLVSSNNFDESTRAVLVNALYFKGNWSEPFKKQSTVESDFHVSKDKKIKLPTMHKSDQFAFVNSKELDAKLLKLPYAGGEAHLLVVLPNEVDGLKGLLEKLKDTKTLAEAEKNMYTTEVNVHLPKFKIETTIDLTQVLPKMGVTKMFSPMEAKLNKLLKTGGDGLYVSSATQKAFIEVNEEGAEAAAANEFGILLASAFIGEDFIADHPFIFMLRVGENTLFSGVFQQ